MTDTASEADILSGIESLKRASKKGIGISKQIVTVKFRKLVSDSLSRELPKNSERFELVSSQNHKISGTATIPLQDQKQTLLNSLSFNTDNRWLSSQQIEILGTKLVDLARAGVPLQRDAFFIVVNNILSYAESSSDSDNRTPTSIIEPKKNKESRNNDKEIFTAEEAAEFLRFEYRLMGVMRQEGTGPKYSCIRGKYRYAKSDLVAWLAEYQEKSSKDAKK